MCGFAGLIENRPEKTRAELCGIVQRMGEAVRHRGPDDAGVWVDEAAGVALAFRRLAILDLSDAGHQPQASHDGRFILVFNGEIYNHESLRDELSARPERETWHGHSDTETLLAGFTAWGVKRTLERTAGMFAVAVWDRDERRLYLARDRFGEKPLYYGWVRGAFVFGSDLKSFREFPGFDNAIDRDALSLYTQYCCIPAPYSIYEHIYKLQPASLLTVPLPEAATRTSRALFAPDRRGGLELQRFWSLDDVVRRDLEQPITDEDSALNQLEAVLSESVRLQCVADVPLGAFLSGGIDSSTIVALMQAQSSRKVKTFTIGFSEAGFNEAEHAQSIAKHLGTDHTELYLSAEQARDVIPSLPALYSEPFADSSQIPTHLVARMARQHVTVALSGDGGDEMLGGYTRHAWSRRVWNPISAAPRAARRAIGSAIQLVPKTTWNTIGRAVPGARISKLGDKAHKLAHWLTDLDSIDDLYRMLATTWPIDSGVVLNSRRLPTLLDVEAARRTPLGEVEQEMMFWDTLTYLPDDILHKVDRAAMGVSLETRAPFLDHRVAELAWRFPLHMKIRQGEGKWILRRLLSKYVPSELIERPKMGFGVPIDSWLRGPLRGWAEDLMDTSRLQSEGFFNGKVVRERWTEHLAGTANWQYELWAILMFQAWLA